MNQITLQRGDHVALDGLEREDYDAAAKAFMDAGCKQGEYPSNHERKIQRSFGWGQGGGLFHGNFSGGPNRMLSVGQVLGASRASKAPKGLDVDAVTTLIEKAKRCREEAAGMNAAAEEAIQKAMQMRPEGWNVERNGDDLVFSWRMSPEEIERRKREGK